MMITKVVLKNFKRFKEQDFDLRGYTVFAGPNNSGKSTVIQAVAAWHFALRQWLASGHKKRSVGIMRKDFSVVPLAEFNQLWTDKLIGYTKSEIEAKIQGARTGARRPLEIEIHGGGKDGEWKLGMEFNYINKDQVYVKPTVSRAKIPAEAKKVSVAHIPPFSGISVEEIEYNHEYQNTLIGQGKPGDILRNLLQDVYEKGEEEWDSLRRYIKDIFHYELTLPSPRGGRHIVSEYKIKTAKKRRGVNLDVNTAGSGFQQVLLLLAFLHARPASVLLIDEPDAHLHINLQSRIYDLLARIAADKGWQLVIATHSEVIIHATGYENITSFFGEHPQNLSNKHERKRLVQAIQRLSTTDLLRGELARDKILFVEGRSDFRILCAWVNALDHRLKKWLLQKSGDAYWQDMHGVGGVKKAQEHFEALTIAFPKMKGFVLVDRNDRPDATHGIDPNKFNLQLWKWKRYEIENYLVHPAVIERFIEEERMREVLFGPDTEAAKGFMADNLARAYIANPLDSELYDNQKASKEFFPPLFEAADLRLDKSEYYRIAEIMRPDEIHGDVIEMLDKMADHFGID